MLFQNRLEWKKNMRPSADSSAIGVDLTRNFDFKWDSCRKMRSVYSVHYPGAHAFSENETIFIKEALLRHKDNTRAYVSIRMNGHSLLYPFAYAEEELDNELKIKKMAYEVTNRVNQRAGVITMFTNDSIIGMDGRPLCGSSVDYAYYLGIPYPFEMRVFLGRTSKIMADVQAFPRGYHSQLLMGYISGIKRLYELVVAEKYPVPRKQNLI